MKREYQLSLILLRKETPLNVATLLGRVEGDERFSPITLDAAKQRRYIQGEKHFS